MGTVVIHAGMPKTGSTSIQAWLARCAARLRRERDIRVVVARTREHGTSPVRLRPYRPGGRLNSGEVIHTTRRRPETAQIVAEGLCTRLDAWADRGGIVVLTSEALAQIFWRGQEAFLSALDELAARHDVRVAYYVRPQHTALEAAWKQWGFRSGASPARYLDRRGRQLHYASTYEATRREAPRISFEPRPFRPDLLASGDVVVDFARRFLGLAGAGELVPGAVTRAGSALSSRGRALLGAVGEGGDTGGRQNPALPLEVANALSQAPPELLGGAVFDNRRFTPLKRLIASGGVVESEQVGRSREVLRAYAHRTFETGNRALIAELGWATESFVPPPGSVEAAEGAELAALDELWRPSASAAELDLLYLALDRALPKRRLGSLSLRR